MEGIDGEGKEGGRQNDPGRGTRRGSGEGQVAGNNRRDEAALVLADYSCCCGGGL